MATTNITAHVKNDAKIQLEYSQKKDAFYKTSITIKLNKKPNLALVQGLQQIIDEYAADNAKPCLEIEDCKWPRVGDQFYNAKNLTDNYSVISDGDSLRIRLQGKGEAESELSGKILYLFAGRKND